MVLAPEQIPKGKAAPAGRRWPRWRRWRVLLIVLATVVAVVLASVAYTVIRYETRPHPGAKAIGSAVNNFRHSGSSTTDSYGLPSAGVYTLHGQGSERISFPPNSQQDGAVMPATVKYLPGNCWRWHIDYNTAHAEEFVFCPTAAGLAQPTNINVQNWNYGAFSVSDTSTVTCPSGTIVLPREASAGQDVSWSCQETNTSVAGVGHSATKARIVGLETLRIGSTDVPAVHELQDTTVSGSQTGTVTENWWFDVTNGLPLRIDRQIVIHTDSPLGTITYTESGSWQMASLTPRT